MLNKLGSQKTPEKTSTLLTRVLLLWENLINVSLHGRLHECTHLENYQQLKKWNPSETKQLTLNQVGCKLVNKRTNNSTQLNITSHSITWQLLKFRFVPQFRQKSYQVHCAEHHVPTHSAITNTLTT